MLASLRGLAPAANGLVLLSTFLSSGSSRRITASLKPVPTRPTVDQLGVLPLPRCTPTSSERSFVPSWVQPPITTSWPARHLAFSQLSERGRFVGRVAALGDDALELHAAGRLQHGVARRLEMLDVADVLASCPSGPPAAPAAAPCARSAAARAGPRRRRTSASKTKKIRSCERPSDSAACRAEKSGAPFSSSAQASPSIMQSGSCSATSAIAWNLSVQSRPLRVLQRGLAVHDAQLQAIAVELDLVHPAGSGRRLLDQLGELRLDERRAWRGPSSPSPCSRARTAVLPPPFLLLCQTAPAVRFFAVMNGVGALPAPIAISFSVRPEATEVSLSCSSASSSPSCAYSSRCLISSQLVRLLSPPAVAAPFHAHQHPAAFEPLAVQGELQVALLQALVRIAFRDPVAAVPQLHRAAAILALRDGALEVAVVERMVLDLDRQPLDRADRATGPWSPPTT